MREAVRQVTDQLAAGRRGDLRTLTLNTLTSAAARAGRALNSAAQRRMAAAYDAVDKAGSLDRVIATATREGLDGQRLCWEIINRESLKHVGLINKECNKLARSLPDRAADDLKGYGWVGLRMALRNFDPERGYAFSTYACPKINGAIRDGVRSESHLPKRLTTFVRKVSRVKSTLGQELGRPPTLQEIAGSMDETVDRLRILPRLSPAASIDEMSVSTDDRMYEPLCLVSSESPEDDTISSTRAGDIRRAVAALPDGERLAVQTLVLDEVPIGKASDALGVGARVLRQRKNRGLELLEGSLGTWAPVA